MKKISKTIAESTKTGERLKAKIGCKFYAKIVDSVVKEHNEELTRLITIKNNN